jgi:hypothetical protein
MELRCRKWSAGVRRAPAAIVLTLAIILVIGCSALPLRYRNQVEPGVTLTQISDHPEQYQGKVVTLGGTRLDEKEHDGHVWLHLRNRPLDKDYKPHLPRDPGSSEGSTYWVTVHNRSAFPPEYQHWARMTVVGRVIGWTNEPASGIREPVLGLMYVRGWGLSTDHDGAWENRIDPNYLLTTPSGLLAPRQQTE